MIPSRTQAFINSALQENLNTHTNTHSYTAPYFLPSAFTCLWVISLVSQYNNGRSKVSTHPRGRWRSFQYNKEPGQRRRVRSDTHLKPSSPLLLLNRPTIPRWQYLRLKVWWFSSVTMPTTLLNTIPITFFQKKLFQLSYTCRQRVYVFYRPPRPLCYCSFVGANLK